MTKRRSARLAKEPGMPHIFLESGPPTDAHLQEALMLMLNQGHSATARDFWIRFQAPGGEPFEASLVSIMKAAENLRRQAVA